ncbi:RHS repeat-associated core domain-containing protein [Ligaoa zhengdingensis]|uniref:RHS repeat-associated core domain-containing protein n=1 Tax=Ligaoa zhengdingensis TaxID=2763658 RepID=UPI0031BAC7CB
MTEYDVWNRQVKVTNDAGTSSYAYYPDGLRYSKTVNGALLRQVWDGTNLAYEYTLGEEDAAVPVRRYARGINAIYVESGDAKSYYLYNAHGDVVQLTDATGTVTQEYEYDAFGNEQNPNANDTNPMRYCGEYFDAETGTIYLRARYCDPRIGRFTASDPAGSGLNWYTYCENNLINKVDPFGLESYVLYDAFDGNEEKVRLMIQQLEKLYGTTAYGIPISTGPELIDVWNNQIGFDLDGNMVPIDATVIMAHGWRKGIGFKTKGGEEFTKYDFSIDRGDINLLDQKEMAALIFLTCNIAQPGGSIANSIFESQAGIKQVIGADGDVYTTIKSEPVTSGILWWKKTTMVPSLYIYIYRK